MIGYPNRISVDPPSERDQSTAKGTVTISRLG